LSISHSIETEYSELAIVSAFPGRQAGSQAGKYCKRVALQVGEDCCHYVM